MRFPGDFAKVLRTFFLQNTSRRLRLDFIIHLTTAQLHSINSELRFCAGSSPARGVSDICDGENLWQWSRLEIRDKRSSLVNYSAKTSIIIITIIIIIIITIIIIIFENFTSGNKWPSCCCMETHVSARHQMEFNGVVLDWNSYVYAYWISVLHCPAILYLKAE